MVVVIGNSKLTQRSAITTSAGGITTVFATDDLWLPINALGVIGALLVLLGLPGMYARIASSSGIRSLPVSTLRSAFQVQPKSAEQPPVVTLTSEEFNDAFTNNRSDITI